MYPQNNVNKTTHPGQNFTKYKICILQFFQNMGFRKNEFTHYNLLGWI